MLIAQITDTHLRADGSLLQGRIDTAKALAAAVDHVNALDPAPDLVLLTGDLADEGRAEDYAALRRAFDRLKAPYAPIPGNHDARGPFRAAFADRPWFGAADGPFLHYAFVRDGLRFVGLDTVLPGQVTGGMCEARLDWLARTLAGEPTTPTMIFLHHPPFATGIRFLDEPAFAGAIDLAELIGRHRQVRLVVCGHAHRAIVTTWAGTTALVAPSTVYQMPLAFRAGERHPPIADPAAVALYLWEPPAPPLGYVSLIEPGPRGRPNPWDTTDR